MKVNTKEHFNKLAKINLEEGLLSALDYDFQVTRRRHSFMNNLCAYLGITYLKKPVITYTDDHSDLIDYVKRSYTATYNSLGKLVRLTLIS
ncbi:MAG: hypothetical protein AABW49_03025 [Nanoarchaeota archaeon]